MERLTRLKLLNYIKNTYKQVNVPVFILILITITLCYLFFLLPHYSPDSYVVILDQVNFAIRLSSQGRPISSLLIYSFNILGINLVHSQIYFTVTAIFFISLSTYLLFNNLKKIWKLNSRLLKLITLLGILAIVANIFTADLFGFPEMTLCFSLALFFCVLALISSTHVSRHQIIITIFWLSLSLLTYQSWGSIFIPLAIIISSPKLRSLFKVLIIYITSATINVLYIKYIHLLLFPEVIDSRTGFGQITSNSIIIFKSLKTIFFNTISFYPAGIFLLLILLIGIIIILSINIRKGKSLIILVLSISSLLIISFLPHLVSGDIWLSARSLIGIASLVGILALFWLSQKKKSTSSSASYFLLILLVGFILSSIISINITARIQFIINQQDKLLIQRSETLISSYENRTKLKIKVIYYKYSSDYSPCYSYYNCTDSNSSALGQSWTLPALFNIYADRLVDFQPFNKDIPISGEQKSIDDILSWQFNEDKAYMYLK